MGPTKLILNPIAGRGYGARIESDLRQLLMAEGLDFDLVQTRRPWHAAELAEQAVAEGFEIIVAAGGDGTTHEVVNGLMAASPDGQTAMLGIIPIGSGSDFASAVGIPADLPGACRRLVHGQLRKVDIGLITMPGRSPQYFDNTLGIGFDGAVTLEARKVKRLRGIALYLPAVLKTVFLYYRAPMVTVSCDGEEMSLRALMVCIANGPREGGGFFVAPRAQPDDGVFDVCIAREVGRLAMLGLIPHFMRGSHVDLEPITMTRARSVTVASSEELVAHMDGEILCTTGHEVRCEILPQRLSVQC